MTIDTDQKLVFLGLFVFIFFIYQQIFNGVSRRSTGSRGKQKNNQDQDLWEVLKDSDPKVCGSSVWLPEGWCFGITWFILYGLIAASAYLLWFEAESEDYRSLSEYRAVMVLLIAYFFTNLLWYPLFFGMRLAIVALVDILINWGVGIALIILAALNKYWISFSFLMVVELWLTYAAFLNALVVSVVKNPYKKSSFV